MAVLLISPATGESISLQQGANGYTGTEDTTIFQDFQDNSAGGFPFTFGGITKASAARRTLIKFHLDGQVPPGATITSATLMLYTEFGRATEVDCAAHRITRAWTEGNNPLIDSSTVGQGAPAQTGDPTWKTAAYGDVSAAWATLGGDFVAMPSGTGHISVVEDWFAVTGTGMVADLQSWLDTGSNHGWMLLVSESGFQNAKRFYSSEGSDRNFGISIRPTLLIDFVPPSAVGEWALY